MKTRSLIVALVLFLGAGCSTFNDSDGNLSLRTDNEEYRTFETVLIEVDNNSSNVVYFSSCMPTTLEQLEAGQIIKSTSFPVCECVCLEDLGKQEKWEYQFSLGILSQSEWGITENTEFRLKLAFFEDERMTTLLDEQVLYTNRFRIIE